MTELGPVWQTGVLRQAEHQIFVETIEGSQAYRLKTYQTCVADRKLHRNFMLFQYAYRCIFSGFSTT